MSWGEVFKINSDMTTPINEKLDNMFKIVPLKSSLIGVRDTERTIANYTFYNMEDTTFGASGHVRVNIYMYLSSTSSSYRDFDITIKNGLHTYTAEKTHVGAADVSAIELYDNTIQVHEGKELTVTIMTSNSGYSINNIKVLLYGMLLPQPDNKSILK